MINEPVTRKSGERSFVPKMMNALLWLVFCAMAGTGLLLAFRLPPGSRGGQGLSAMGLSRHDWGDLHTWLSYAFLTLILIHLLLHWRWFWQVAARKKCAGLWQLVLEPDWHSCWLWPFSRLTSEATVTNPLGMALSTERRNGT